MHETTSSVPLPLSVSYDFHYSFARQELPQAQALLTESQALVRSLTARIAEIAHAQLFDTPGGPWKTPMWFVKISVLPRQMATKKAKVVFYDTMIQCAQQLRALFIEKKALGSFFVHANIYPENTDMVQERHLHFDRAWQVYGPPPQLNDIWSGPSGLIALQAFMQDAYDPKRSKESMIEALLSQFEPIARFDTATLTRYGNILIEAIKKTT